MQAGFARGRIPNRKSFLFAGTINYPRKRQRVTVKSRSTRLVGAMAACFLVLTLFSCCLGWLNACPRVYATWDVPPRPVPIVSFDLCTQKGGVGPGVLGGEFGPGETVAMYVKVTSDGLPVENVTIGFEITGPANSHLNVSFVRTAATNSSGIAYQTFSVPPVNNAQEAVLGTWSVMAQMGLDQETVGDTLDFEVVSASMYSYNSACTCARATFKLLR
jgi:hypothetical protein